MRIRLTNVKFREEMKERMLRAIASSGITPALAYDPSGMTPPPNFGQQGQDNPTISNWQEHVDVRPALCYN